MAYRFAGTIWQAPMVPIALAATAGIVADHYAAIPLLFSLLFVVVSLVAWLATRTRTPGGLSLVYLGLAAAALGAAYHRWYLDGYPPGDIGNFAGADPHPVRLKGVILEEPAINWQVHKDPLRSMESKDPTVAVLGVSQLRQLDGWITVSGRARLVVTERLPVLHVGDEVEVIGRLSAPRGPANPGEFDYAGHLRDQHVRALVTVQKTPNGVIRLAERWPQSFHGWLGFIRAWCQGVLDKALPQESYGVASALLLGDSSIDLGDDAKHGMSNEDWDKYIRTGVIHVLAISGQHLVVLAAFLWAALRLLGVRQRRGALGVALFLVAYSLMTGGRPPIMRSAVTVSIFCLGILIRRPSLMTNSFALAWLVVAALNPTDIFNAGCQLSFLAVAVLYWGTGRWFRYEPDPLERLVEESRPRWHRCLRWIGAKIGISYAITAVIWLAAAPLVADHYHLLSTVGLLIGPPVVLLGSVALITGFLLLFASLVWWPIAVVFGWLTHTCLSACESLVNWADRLPGGHWYVSDLSQGWLWIFYIGLFAFLWLETLRLRGRLALSAGAAWVCVGLVAGWARPAENDFRCTFLAVGHGGCTVLETPDGRVLLYDAGSLGGPDVTRRQIAPFLWSRGIRRIDEVFLSHADLDHFNGLPALLDRFAVGQVSCTPTFADKTAPGVPVTLTAIRDRGIPIRIIKAGDRLTAGPVEMQVVHPSAAGPEGKENFRSLVLLVRHGVHSMLLTGDLEGPGLEQVLALPLEKVDILMAPHHGSRAGDRREVANRSRLALKTQPRVIVSCQGLPRGSPNKPNPYTDSGAQFLGTWPNGAVTIRSAQGRLTVETFQSGQRFDLTAR
jgi:competence protein ComEC